MSREVNSAAVCVARYNIAYQEHVALMAHTDEALALETLGGVMSRRALELLASRQESQRRLDAARSEAGRTWPAELVRGGGARVDT